MPERPPVPEDERRLFRESVGRVRPLAHQRQPPARPKPAPVPRQSQLDAEQALREMAEGLLDPAVIETGEELNYARPGLQHQVFRRLRRGQFAVAAELDLHGMNTADARAAVAGFLADCIAANRRCVRIIHGKGYGSPERKPVLKGMLNQWLKHRREVLAFCSARPVDGGTGAIYVLLARQ
jgi:DNA-nicking Smr family endonuclease